MRLRSHVAGLFLKQKGVKSDVYKNERAMTKLLKESTRIKQILSANQDTVCRVRPVASCARALSLRRRCRRC